MVYFENIIRFLLIVLGFSYILGCFIVFKKTKIIEYSLYLKGYISLFIFHLTELFCKYIIYTTDSYGSNVKLVTTTILYASIAIYLVNYLKVSTMLLNRNSKGIVARNTKLIYLLFFVIYLLALGQGEVQTLDDRLSNYFFRAGLFYQLPLFLITLIVLFKFRKNFIFPLARRLVKALCVIVLIYTPFLLVELILFHDLKLTLEYRQISSFYLVFLVWTIVSTTIYIRFTMESSPTIKFEELSKRENEIVELMISGRISKEISDILFISPRTVEKHISNIYKKIGVSNRVELLKYYS